MAHIKNLAIIAAVTVVSTVAVWITVGLTTVRQNFDGPFYAVVAKSWYNPDIIRVNFSFPLPLEYYPAHFPLYPALMRLVDEFSGIGYLNAGLIINLLATVGVAWGLYYIGKKLKFPAPLLVSLVWLFWWPRIWAVRSIASPETLFIFFIIFSLYFFEKRKFALAGIAGAAATLTKSPGILLFVAYSAWLVAEYIKTKKVRWQTWPILLIPISLFLLFSFYYLQLGDFWAYFHSGDNIHLQALPFKIFDSTQPWVGDFWLEDVLWVYLVGAIGVWRAWIKNRVWGWFGIGFYLSLLFVSHRDIGRYSLPLVPIVLYGLAEIFAKKEVRWALALAIIPLFAYTTNFLSHNTVAISNWAPFLAR